MVSGRSAAIAVVGAATVLLVARLIMGGQKKPARCVFCHPLNGVVYEDDDFIAFHDIKPDAELHILVIPRAHYGTIRELTATELPTIKRMHEIGQRLLDERGYAGDKARFGFHRPPFNSIHHLHLHCLGLPFRSRRAAIPFPENGSAWFMPAQQLIDSLAVA